MPTQNVNLSEKQRKFIRDRVDGGDFRNASEVVRAGLRLLEQRDQEDRLKLRAPRRAAKGTFDEIDRGKFEIVEPGEIGRLTRMLAKKARARRP